MIDPKVSQTQPPLPLERYPILARLMGEAPTIASATQVDIQPLTEDVIVTGDDPAHRPHPYHTKVPVEAIRRCTRHYCPPGGRVLDCFCGSGTTGLAALLEGRKADLSDLSTLAAFIARNMCDPTDPAEFRREAEQMLASVGDEARRLYATHCRRCGGPAETLSVAWSYRYECPECGKPFTFGDQALDAKGQIMPSVNCPECGQPFAKSRARRLDRVPVLISYRCLSGCGGKKAMPVAPVDEWDREHIAAIEAEDLPEDLWYPTDPIPDGINTRQLLNMDITTVDRLYTRRNLRILARLWQVASSHPDPDMRRKLLFALTACYKRITLMAEHRYRAGAGNTPNLYVPALVREQNVVSEVRRKAGDIGRYLEYVYGRIQGKDALVSVRSATDLNDVPDGWADYVFIDPPFGDHIQYAELNFLLEAWLGAFTDRRTEAVINRQQSKGLAEFRGLLIQSLKEIHRVLRPGGWMTVVFHSSSAGVWQVL